LAVWQVGILSGVVASLGYLLRAHRNDRSPSLQGVINIVLACGAGSAALRLAYVAWTASDADFKPFDGEDRVYVFLGGVALLWVTAAEIFRQYRSVDRVASAVPAASPVE